MEEVVAQRGRGGEEGTEERKRNGVAVRGAEDGDFGHQETHALKSDVARVVDVRACETFELILGRGQQT